jgi:phospholipid transport system transporter-binding protein
VSELAAAAAQPLALAAAPRGFELSGELTLAQVGPWRERGRKLLAGAAAGGTLRMGLGGVTRVDSAGLALLVDWLAWARAARCTLAFEAVPPALLALARLSDLEDLIEGRAAGQTAGPPA